MNFYTINNSHVLIYLGISLRVKTPLHLYYSDFLANLLNNLSRFYNKYKRITIIVINNKKAIPFPIKLVKLE